jgi:hypothetical protein
MNLQNNLPQKCTVGSFLIILPGQIIYRLKPGSDELEVDEANRDRALQLLKVTWLPLFRGAESARLLCVGTEQEQESDRCFSTEWAVDDGQCPFHPFSRVPAAFTQRWELYISTDFAEDGGEGLEAIQLQVAMAASLQDVGGQGPDWELEEALRLSIMENRAKEDQDEQTRLGIEASLRESAPKGTAASSSAASRKVSRYPVGYPNQVLHLCPPLTGCLGLLYPSTLSHGNQDQDVSMGCFHAQRPAEVELIDLAASDDED